MPVAMTGRPENGGVSQMVQPSLRNSEDRARGRMKSHVSRKRVVMRVWRHGAEGGGQKRRDEGMVRSGSNTLSKMPGEVGTMSRSAQKKGK